MKCRCGKNARYIMSMGAGEWDRLESNWSEVYICDNKDCEVKDIGVDKSKKHNVILSIRYYNKNHKEI